ncbi:MAG: zinc-dependent peptidase [Rheinheimera sp.]|nr:zinc-dependent peptidase [Rheinheimera sp.]
MISRPAKPTALPISAVQHDINKGAQHFSQAFALLQRQINQQQSTFLDPYAATNPAEFFAVATEAFFEQPEDFQKVYPNLYPLMRTFYQLDPITWQQH